MSHENPPQALDVLTFPLTGSRLIEASAGTGKTWTIAMLYLRLVLQHGDPHAFVRPLAPQDILVVTFTRAATEELRERIRQRLGEAAALFRDPTRQQADPILLALRATYPTERWPALALRLERAASSMDESAIFTIHGWAQRMLQQHAFDSGSRFQQTLESDESVHYQEATRDYWRTFIYPLAPALLQAVHEMAEHPDTFARLLRHWPWPDTEVRDPFAALQDWLHNYEAAEQAAQAQWRQSEAQVTGWFREALEHGWINRNVHRVATTLDVLNELSVWAQGRGAQVFKADRHGKIAASRLKLGSKGTHPDFPVLHALDTLCDIQATRPNLRRPLLDHAKAWCSQRVARRKQRLGVMAFDDLLRQLDQALHRPNGENLAALLQRQYPVALIDEFQDTDPTQYRLFQRIYLQASNTDRPFGLFLIGDPKQAIYGFRGADVYTYLQARRATTQQYTLGTNFRSTTALVAAVNAIFTDPCASDDTGSGPFLHPDIPYLPVNARGRTEQLEIQGKPAPALTFWTATEPYSKTRYQATLSEACASAIVDLLQGARHGTTGFRQDTTWQPLVPSDIAILVRSHTEASAIRTALSRRGVRSAYLSDRESPFATREARDLLSWLQAIAEPGSDSLIRMALVTPSLDLPLDILDTAPTRSAEGDAQWEGYIEAFHGYRQRWQQQGILVMLRRFMDDFGLPARLLDPQQAEGERRLTNLLQLGELLQQAATRLDGEHALIRHLAEQIEDAEARAQDDQVLRLESDDDLIKVITIHKSKGLEYPLVFLPFIGAAMPVNRKNRSFFRYHDEQGKVCVDFDLSTEGEAREDQERLAEDLRLLYVALTRARHACWLGLPPLGKDNKSGYGCLLQHSAIGQRLGGGLPLPPETLRARLEALAANDGIAVHDLPDIHLQGITNDTAAVALQPARSLTQRLHTPWWIASYSGLLDQHAEAPLAPPNAPLPLAEDSPAEATASEAFMDEAAALLPVAPPATDTRAGLHDFPRGAQAGTFLHSLLEWAAAEGFARIASDTARRAAQVEQRCATRGWQDWSAPLTDALGHILRAPLPLPTPAGRVLSLSALSADQLQVELEFWFEAHTVSITRIDALLHRHILPGRPRPPLRAGLLNGMLKGFIDLVFMHQDRYYLADYKSNWLGENASAYTAEAMAAAILAHRYDLQYSLYTLALHRLLRARLPDYVYARDLGGVLYVFLRGIGEPGQPHTQGVHAVQPPFALIDALDRLFSAQPVTDTLHEPV